MAADPLQPQFTNQLEALEDDLDLSSLVLRTPGLANLPILEATTDGSVTRTVEGASSVQLSLDDHYRLIERSGHLNTGCTITLSGLVFNLLSVDMSGDTLTLTFEDHAVALLKKYPVVGPDGLFDPLLYNAGKPANWTAARVGYAQRLVQDASAELTIPFVTPITPKPVTTQPFNPAPPVGPGADAKKAHRAPGLAPGAKLTIKGGPASPIPRANIEKVLETGAGMNASPRVLTAAVMVVIQESSGFTMATNGPHVGLFQQDSTPGSAWVNLGGATRDPAKDAKAFFTVAERLKVGAASESLAQFCEDIQVSGLNPQATYGQWQDEAAAWVTAFMGSDAAKSGKPPVTHGSSPGDTPAPPTSFDAGSSGSLTNLFYRGRPVQKGGPVLWKRESDWAALQRLAQEVDWRCFIVSGFLYFTYDDALFQSQPLMRISRDSPGVDAIDGQYTVGTRTAELTVTGRIGLWQAPPGSVVELYDMGPMDGRWLVTTISRPLFTPQGSITLKKPQPTLPESEAPEHESTGGSVVVTQTPGGKVSAAPAGPAPKIKIAPPSVTTGTSATLARKLLTYVPDGYDSNPNSATPLDVDQIRKVAAGGQLVNKCGHAVTLDPRVLQALLFLVQSGFKIRTFALVENHFCPDGLPGYGPHSNGTAVDISDINGHNLGSDGSPAMKQLALTVLNALESSGLKFGQVISGGVGGHRDDDLRAKSRTLSLGGLSDSLLDEHLNHIHVGFIAP